MHCRLALLIALAVVLPPVAWAQPTVGELPADEEEDTPHLAADPRQLVVTFADDSRLKAVLAEETVVMQTPHGKLSIPAGDVRRIDFALRLSDQDKEQIQRRIEALASGDATARRQAAAELLEMKERAAGALEAALLSATPEVAKELDAVLDKMWEKFPESDLTSRELDLVQTPDAKIAGKIVSAELRLRTTQFGELKLKLSDARSIRSLALPEPEPEEKVDVKNALPDPGNLNAYQSQVGKSFLFKVTGAASGTMYGTGTYTTDSQLSAAAVHSGILKVGETGVVKVTMLGQVPSFVGSTQHGLSSNGYGGYPGFELTKAKKVRVRKK